MRSITITFEGDDWDDEEEAEDMESQVEAALDNASIGYSNVSIN